MLKRNHKTKTYYLCSAVIALTLAVNPFLANNSYAAPSTTTTKAKVEQALNQYQAAKKEYDKIQTEIASSDKRLNDTFQQLTKLNQEQDETKKRLDSVLVRLYTSGHNNMEAQLLASTSFSEFLSRLEGIRLLMENDYQVYQKYKDQAEAIQKNQAAIKQEAANSKQLLDDAEKKMKQLQAEYKALQKQLKSEQLKALAKSSGVSDPGKLSDTSWLNKARAMIGKVNYVFGAESYPNFDCSGWVQYVFREYRGINLPRTSEAQSQVGTSVSRSNLQPGDLIFLQGTYKSGVSHVGIYLGDGLYISNENEKNDLQIDSLNNSYSQTHYWGAKRVN
ncbi:NlpC/P60 family protein [Shimazuella sp. AN120528]|uniref:C40 family peptidase n=1 Tax=Shimazuella soli TaxID=1892854 RepID=UPI001F0F6417|nr:C40 family peptidase [Shimazuella soli]MCH5583998.1 NlpC/P60 family protein [Shimazuella soli]